MVLIPILAVVAGAIAVAPATRPSATADDDLPTARPLPVSVFTLEDAAGFERTRTFTGQIEARRTSVLGFEQGGELDTVLVGEGTAVEKGCTLATLDTRRLQAQRDAVAARRDVAAAVVTEMAARERRLAVRRDRVVQMRERSAASADELDEATFEHQATAAQLDAARHRVTELDASLAMIDVDLEDSRIVAPFDGRIDRRLADEGAILAPGMPVLRLVESGVLEAWIGVPVDAAPSFTDDATYTLRVGGRDVPATVSGRMPRLDDATRTVRVVLRLDDATDIVPGQIARVAVRETLPGAGFSVPATALVRGERGLWSVYTLRDADDDTKTIARAVVEVLHTDGERAFVRGALTPGQVIVATGVHRLAPGQHVATVND